MKGLLLKDWYMAAKYCRLYLVISAAFIVFSAFEESSLFFLFYPCMLCGMIPVNLLGYDERSRWLTCCDTLPCTRAQFVSAKYLIGLLGQLAVLLLTGIAQSIKMSRSGGFAPQELAFLLLTLLAVALLSTATTLPFIFRLGVEKGRAAYFVMVGIVCGAGALATRLSGEAALAPARTKFLPAALTAAAICLYALSWMLSVRFYQKREL